MKNTGKKAIIGKIGKYAETFQKLGEKGWE
jgi:hypothetical protein